MKSAGGTGSGLALVRGVMVGLAALGLMSLAAPAFAQTAGQQSALTELLQLESATSAAVLGVVDRPDAPFVSGLAADTPAGSCTPALWTRGSTDQTKTKGSGEVDVGLSNIEFGADVSCFNVGKSGLDITGGLIGGKGTGSGTAVALPGGLVSVDQTFYGAYAAFSSNGLTGDVQVRDDKFNFTASGLTSLGVNDGTQVGADRMAVSGSLAYAFKLGSDMQLIPAVGFDISRTTTGTLGFSDGSSGSLDAIQGKIGFIGATLAKTVVLPDGTSAVVPFLTATYYDDFSPQITGTFTPNGGSPGTLPPADGTGSFTELSAGLNYVKVLDKGSALKQVTAAIRGDLRFNDKFTGEALTAQLRLQF